LTSAASEQQSDAWFGSLGSPLAAADLVNSRAYLDALGYPPELATISVGSWQEAERIVRASDWDRAWWEQEDRERDHLKGAAERRLGSTGMLERLTAAVDSSADAIHAAAIVAMARTGYGADAMVHAASGANAMVRAASGANAMVRAASGADAMVHAASGADAMVRAASGADAMVRAASGAAMMAAHEFALAQLAGCGPDHLFMRKYSLFKSGRWPLGVLRGAFHLF